MITHADEDMYPGELSLEEQTCTDSRKICVAIPREARNQSTSISCYIIWGHIMDASSTTKTLAHPCSLHSTHNIQKLEIA